ncbi:MAG: hypothetical protein ACREIQ_08770 [Nitrospiria bacterium]
MQWDWGNITLAVAALVGLLVWVINFCCMSHAETSVPDQQTQSVGQTNGINGKEARVRDLEKRLAVIRSSAEMLMANGESDDEVKRELCRFIIEEAEQLSSSFSRV